MISHNINFVISASQRSISTDSNIIYPMGQQKSKVFRYELQTGEVIKYNTTELKDDAAFTQTPSSKQVQQRFQQCLNESVMSDSLRRKLNEMGLKYKHRFAELHELMKEALKKQEKVKPNPEVIEDQLESKLHAMQQGKQSLKLSVGELEDYLSSNQCYDSFIKVNGVTRLLEILAREVDRNRKGLKYSYSNEIDVMKLLRKLQTKENDLYMDNVECVKSYFQIILYNLHRVNPACTVSVIDLLLDYIWSCKDSSDPLDRLQSYIKKRKDKDYDWVLAPFVETILTTDNILIVYHVIRFINDLYSSLIDNSRLEWFRKGLRQNNYHLILEIMRKKLQTGAFELQSTTFDSIRKKMFENQPLSNTNSLSITELIKKQQQQQLSQPSKEDPSSLQESISTQPDDQFDIYLTNNNQKMFQNYLNRTLNLINEFYTIESTLNNQSLESTQEKERRLTEIFEFCKNKCKDKHITDVLLRIMDNLQYLDADGWRDVDFVVRRKGGQLDPQELEQDQRERSQLKVLKEDLLEKDKRISEVNAETQQLRLELSRPKDFPPQSNTPVLQKGNQNPSSQTQHDSKEQKVSLPPPPPPPPLPSLPPTPALTTSPQIVPSALTITPPSTLPPPPPLLPISSSSPTSSSSIPAFQSGVSSILPPPPPPPSASSLETTFSGGIPPPPPLELSLPTKSLGSVQTTLEFSNKNLKPCQKPSIPLKACMITTIPFDKIKGTVWEDMTDNKVEIDKPRLERLFAKEAKSEVKMENKSVVVSEAKFLDSNRVRNIEIVLTKLRMSVPDILKSVEKANMSNKDTLERISSILPTTEEEEKSKTWAVHNDIHRSEEFVWRVSQIPKFRERLRALLFISEKNHLQVISSLLSTQQELIGAFEVLKNSVKFQSVLETSLAIANYLNSEDSRRGAWGLKIDSLKRLSDTKSGDGTDTVATQMASMVLNKYLPWTNDDIVEVDVVERYSVAWCKQQQTQINEELRTMRAASESEVKGVKDQIRNICDPAIKEITESLDQIVSNQQTLETSFRECASFYCEGDTQPSEEFGKKIVDCYKFVAETENEIREREEREKSINLHKSGAREVSYRKSVDLTLFSLEVERDGNPFETKLAPSGDRRRQNIYNRLKIAKNRNDMEKVEENPSPM